MAERTPLQRRIVGMLHREARPLCLSACRCIHCGELVAKGPATVVLCVEDSPGIVVGTIEHTTCHEKFIRKGAARHA